MLSPVDESATELGRHIGALCGDELAQFWTGEDHPEWRFGADFWVWKFRNVGYTFDAPDVTERPTEPLTIYRGSTWGRRRGMSWTTDLELAFWYAGRFDPRRGGPTLRDVFKGTRIPADRRPGHVFAATIEPQGILARIEDGLEAEVVVDPAYLPKLGRASMVAGCSPLTNPWPWERMVPHFERLAAEGRL